MLLRRTPLPGPTPAPGGRRADDRAGGRWTATRDLLLASVFAPVRPVTRPVLVLGALVVLAETMGLVARRTCPSRSCGAAAASWAHRLDLDAIGSLPRSLVTVLLAAAALQCARAVWRAGRGGAAVWWLALALGCTVLAAAKHWSLHSLVELRLGRFLPGTDVQLLFIAVSSLGLLAAVLTGRWVRRDTRTAVVTWLALYAVAAVGLAALTNVAFGLGAVVGDVVAWLEETGEGLAAVGLLAVLTTGIRDVSRRDRATATAQ